MTKFLNYKVTQLQNTGISRFRELCFFFFRTVVVSEGETAGVCTVWQPAISLVHSIDKIHNK